ncbi:MAG: hypothetical protein QOJ29_1510 [Thermoleophilaceae bacterium]|nr:hypothetical protein [Thermoleophilaceae bacterium]
MVVIALATPAAEPTISVFTPAGGSSRSHLTPDRRGFFTVPGVKAACPDGESGPCTFTAAARRKRVLVATASIQVAAGAHSGLRMHLTPAGKKLLRTRRIAATTTVELTTKSGKRAVVALTLGLSPR